MDNTGFARITDCNNSAIWNGINAQNSVYTADANNINNAIQAGVYTAIANDRCPSANVINNIINTDFRGIEHRFGGGLVDHNTITLLDNIDPENDSGIYSYMTDVRIEDNTVSLTNGEAGIWSVGGINQSILNNIVNSDGGDRGIVVEASNNHTIGYNISQGDPVNAIRVVNSSMGIIECNEVEGWLKGINVHRGSPFQQINQNFFSGTAEIDFRTQSLLGIQDFRNNEGWCYAEALGLSQQDVFNSRFIVEDLEEDAPNCDNDPNTVDWAPVDFFEEQVDINQVAFTCTGSPGPGFVEPTIICDIFVAPVDITEYDQWTLSYHMLRHFEGSNPIIDDKPNCLDLDETIPVNSEMIQLVRTELDFRSTLNALKLKSISIQENLSQSGLEGSGNISESDRFNMTELYDEIASAETHIQGLVIQLTSMTTSTDISEFWKTGLILVMDDWLYGDESSTTIDLTYMASLCADAYGDPVQWARGVLSRTSQLSYDDNDDCGESIEPRSRLEQRTPNKIKLYPNPASNTLSLTKSYPGTVKIVIRNIKGATLIETTTEADNLELDVSSLESGVYTVKTEFADKTIEIDKLVIL